MQLNMFSNVAKRVTKMMDKAKAALEERQENSKKRKNDGGSEDTTAPKKSCPAQQRGNTKDNNSVPSRTSASPLRRRVTIEDVPDEDDTFTTHSGSGNITSSDESSESRSSAGGPESPDNELTHIDHAERLMKEWTSPVYAFFEPIVTAMSGPLFRSPAILAHLRQHSRISGPGLVSRLFSSPDYRTAHCYVPL
ncbi:hypothetical protein BU15DRAFT_59946 [Melanogaster broomeanus]|nr:hypothetical protein BU15DRAFT_59946 [Melanogaster broomeanus]